MDGCLWNGAAYIAERFLFRGFIDLSVSHIVSNVVLTAKLSYQPSCSIDEVEVTNETTPAVIAERGKALPMAASCLSPVAVFISCQAA